MAAEWPIQYVYIFSWGVYLSQRAHSAPVRNNLRYDSGFASTEVAGAGRPRSVTAAVVATLPTGVLV